MCASTLVPAAAQASTAQFTFWNMSSAPEYVAFPYRSWMTSTIVKPHDYWTGQFSGLSPDEAVAYRYINGQWPAVATKYFDDSQRTVMYG